MVFVALAATAAETSPPTATKTATLWLTKSAASAGNLSESPFAQRYSILTVWPSIKPASAKPCRNAEAMRAESSGDRPLMKPTTGIAACCARATSGQVAAPPSRVMSSRRLIGFVLSAGQHRYQSTLYCTTVRLPHPCPLWVKSRHSTAGVQCPLYPRNRTLKLSRAMSALCQKQTFRLPLDIIDGGQGCSNSWSITRETSPPAISAPGRGRCAAPDLLAHCNGANLSVAAGAPDRRFCRWRRI